MGDANSQPIVAYMAWSAFVCVARIGVDDVSPCLHRSIHIHPGWVYIHLARQECVGRFYGWPWLISARRFLAGTQAQASLDEAPANAGRASGNNRKRTCSQVDAGQC